MKAGRKGVQIEVVKETTETVAHAVAATFNDCRVVGLPLLYMYMYVTCTLKKHCRSVSLA